MMYVIVFTTVLILVQPHWTIWRDCRLVAPTMASVYIIALKKNIFNPTNGVRTALFSCYRAMPRETSAVSALVLCIPYNHVPVYGVTSFKVT